MMARLIAELSQVQLQYADCVSRQIGLTVLLQHVCKTRPAIA
jgi:hypothetical protein